MESTSKEEVLEKLDQEITVNLQKIDSNLSFCFNKITQDIIPHVAKYSEVCERIMDSTEWLGTMFQETGLVNLQGNAVDAAKGKIDSDAGIFPASAGNSSEEFQVPNGPSEQAPVIDANRNTHSVFTNENTDDFHTANITSTGQVLKLPDSSDEDNGGDVLLSSRGQRDLTEEDRDEASNDQDESTIQRQSRKRKISLLLQQQYGSSSSMVPSPIAPNKIRKQLPHENHNSVGIANDNDENGNRIESSPLKQEHRLRRADADDDERDEEESTKEVPKPGTIIHFSTNR
ncbi:ask1p [Saccharomyces arboricola H-6]|uniref:DASH complex subunit ASK1 n=1 Tax=Saccharomyces arboricola (strain H-6 / AS 2.3317 / CBS 10644) TaxID=1160507 RepID=J8Q2K2_SACAR|nr:ask1p [Saccharomyces arboricola H-6]